MRGPVVVVLIAAVVAVGAWLLLSEDAAERFGQTRDEDADGPILLGGESRGGEVTVEPAVFHTVTGVVVDEAGNPVAAVPVRAHFDFQQPVPDNDLAGVVERAFEMPQQTSGSISGATTDADGRFALPGIARRVVLRVEPTGRWISTEVRVDPAIQRKVRLEVERPRIITIEHPGPGIVDVTSGRYWSRAELSHGGGRETRVFAPSGPTAITVYQVGRLHHTLSADADRVAGIVSNAVSVSGKVTSSDGEPIDRARVYVKTAATANAKAIPRTVGLATTDDHGQYKVIGLTPGYVLRMIVSAPGFVPVEVPIQRRRVKPDEMLDIDVVLRRGATLEGTVRGPDGAPIEGATVKLGRWHERVAVTEADGHFHFDGLRTDDWKVFVSAPGLFQQTKPVIASVMSHETPTDVTIQMARGEAVTGRVVLASGAPAGAGIAVVAHEPGAEFLAPPATTAWTDDDGTFAIAASRGRILAFTALGKGLKSAESEPWIHVPGQAPPELELVVRPTATLAGVVLDGEDQPVEGVYVQTGHPKRGVTTGQDGAWRFEHLLPGETLVFVEDKVMAGWGDADIRPHGFTLDWGDVVDDVVLRCTSRSYIAGIVVDGEGNPQPGVSVSTRSTDAGWIHANPGGTFEVGDHGTQATTDEAGRFRLAGLWGGETVYELRVDGIDIPGTQKAPQDDLRIVNDGLLDRVVRGRVVGKDGTEVGTAHLAVRPLAKGEDPEWSEYDEIGWHEFAVPVVNGEFEVRVQTEAIAIRVAASNPRTASGRRADLLGFTKRDLVITDEPLVIELDPSIRITGRCVDESGDGVPGIEVGLAYVEDPLKDEEWSSSRIASYGPNEGRFQWPYSDDRTTTSGADGRFTFHGIYDQDLYLRTRGRPEFARIRPFEVIDRSKPVEITVTPSGSIRGRVVGPDGEPLARVGVLVGNTESATTDLDGNFHIQGLHRTGTVTLQVGELRNPARPYFPAKVENVAIGSTDVVIELRVGAILTGTIVDRQGEPVIEGRVTVRAADRPDDEPATDSIHATYSTAFEIGPLEPGEYLVGLQAGWGQTLDAFLRKPVRVTVPGPPLRLVVERTWDVAGTWRNLDVDPNVIGTFDVKWIADESIDLPGDDDDPFGMGISNRGVGWVDAESKTWSISRVREDEGRVYAWQTTMNRYALLDVRKGEGPYELVFQDGYKISGKVEGSVHELTLRQGRLERRIQVNGQTKTFSFSGLPPGRWTLVKKLSQWDPEDPRGPELVVEAGTEDVVYRMP